MSTAESHRYLIAYDIVDDLRRSHLAKVLERYGDRVQYSVFLVECVPARLLRLRSAMSGAIQRLEDSVLVCDLGPVKSLPPWSAHYLGRSREVTARASIIV